MKRILALAYLGFMLFSLSLTAENAISINILGNEQEDARFYFLECREEILNETKYKISYKSANITVEDLSLLTNREYDVVLLYQKVLQAAVERDLLLPINDTALNHDWTALAVYLSKDDVMYGLPYYYIANLFLWMIRLHTVRIFSFRSLRDIRWKHCCALAISQIYRKRKTYA